MTTASWRIGAAGLVLLGLAAAAARATENGRSTYAPGTSGDFALAVLPDAPGFYLRNEFFHYSGRNRYEAQGGALKVNADLAAWVDIPRVTWVSGARLLGARHGAYLAVPAAYVRSEARVETAAPGAEPGVQTVIGHRFAPADAYLAPLILDWKAGAWNVMAYETITIPSGSYDSGETVNASRNHWAAHSSLAATWRHPKGGPEADLRLGYILNGENPETDYRDGDEWVTDWTAAWRVNAAWAFGLTGYFYRQVSGDSGDGAQLGDFKGRSAGAGPVVRRAFTCAGRRVSLVGKWLHEFDASNRYEGDLYFMAWSVRL